MPKGATRAKRAKRPFCCPDGQRLPDGKRKADAVAKEFYNTQKGQKRAKNRKLLPSSRWRWHEVSEGSFACICVSLALFGLTKKQQKGLTHRPAPTSLSIKEALLVAAQELKKPCLKQLTSLAPRNPRGVTDSTLPATNCCKSCRLQKVIDNVRFSRPARHNLRLCCVRPFATHIIDCSW